MSTKRKEKREMAKKFKPVDCDPFGERRLNAPGDGD